MSSSKTTSKKSQSKDIVSLPPGRTTIMLPPALAAAANLLIHNQGKFVNTFQLRDQGVASVSQYIARLEEKGAIIDRSCKPAIDGSGNWHERVAHYRFRGWL